MPRYDTLTSSSAKVLCAAAYKKGINYKIISSKYNLVKLTYKEKSFFIKASSLPFNSITAMAIADNKYLTKKVLLANKIDSPLSFRLKTSKSIKESVKNNNLLPCVLKPVFGAHGADVYTNIETEAELTRILKILFKNQKKREILLEEYIQGNDYRVFVLNGKVEAVMQRIPAHVVGDGIHTIKQLVKRHNQNPLIGKGYEKPMFKIIIDDEVLRILKKQKKSLTYIPSRRETIFLRQNANISTGGIGKDVTDEIRNSIKQVAVSAANAIGLNAAGVDIIFDDLSKKPYVIEINASAGYDMHHYPAVGKKRDVAGKILDYLFDLNKILIKPSSPKKHISRLN
jgi:cyanophycin synthetase